MPALTWIGKSAVVKHHLEVPYRSLVPIEQLCVGDPNAGNLIVEGDNLHALRSLLPRFGGRVKCIYIDPPYNTGIEGWAYNDNVNSPEIRKWLGEVVGREGETLDRHDRWLCMMYPRLTLLRRFLKRDGAIFVSIDDNELGNLQSLMREIFGPANEVATLVWEKGKKGDAKLVSVTHEYVVVFARDKAFLRAKDIKWRRKKQGADEVLAHYQSLRAQHGPDHAELRRQMMSWYRSLPADDPRKSHKHYNHSDDRGLYFAADFAGPDDGRENRPRYNIPHPVTGQPCKIPSTGWRWEEPRTLAALAAVPPLIHFGPDHTTIPNRKSYLFEIDTEPMSSVFYKDGRAATLEVEAILGAGEFQFPKDSDVIADLVGVVAGPGDIVLDSFAGSGTTAHAVLNLNQTFAEPVKFILVEMDRNVATTRTRERVKRVIEGYTPISGRNREQVRGLGSGFQYCRLSEEPLFAADGRLREGTSFRELAEFLWFSETGTAYTGSADSPLLGVHEGKGIYLLFNGILRDRTDLGGNVLNTRTLAWLAPQTRESIVYAARSRFDDKRLKTMGVEFKQLPYRLAQKTWN